MARIRAKYRKDEKGREVLQTYIAEFYDRQRQPKLKRVSLATRDERAARQRFAQYEREYMAGLYDPWTDAVNRDGVLVSEAIEAFVKSRDGCSEKTISNYANVLRIFRKSLPPGMMMQAIETRHVEGFLNGQSLNGHSRQTYTRHLGVFFRWCMEQGFLKDDPTPERARVRRRQKKTLPKFLTEEQAGALLRVIEADAVLKQAITDGNRWLTNVVRFALGTGLRRGEVCNFRWDHVDLHTGLLNIRNTDTFETKSGHERAVPLVGEARTVIEVLQRERASEADDYVFKGMRGGKLNDEHLSRRFRFYRRLARLPEKINFHSLRHTFASWWVLRGGDLYRLKEVMGHADIQTTMIYAHLRPDALREEMEKCFGTGQAAATISEVEQLRAQVEMLMKVNAQLREAGTWDHVAA